MGFGWVLFRKPEFARFSFFGEFAVELDKLRLLNGTLFVRKTDCTLKRYSFRTEALADWEQALRDLALLEQASSAESSEPQLSAGYGKSYMMFDAGDFECGPSSKRGSVFRPGVLDPGPPRKYVGRRSLFDL